MCGISGIIGRNWQKGQLESMVASLRHRGPDAQGIYQSGDGQVGLGHNRLSILDLSAAGRQPMSNRDESLQMVFNGEIYNYKELYHHFPNYPFKSRTDSEIVLAAYEKWGENCLRHFIGMFAFAIWDDNKKKLFCARDRFGVKPFYYCFGEGQNFFFASEIKALHAAGFPKSPNEKTWATYLGYGLYDHGEATFWKDINSLKAGHSLILEQGKTSVRRWYALEDEIGKDFDNRSEAEITEEYLTLLHESLRLRCRSDVPVGVNLSGGLDSSILLSLLDQRQGHESEIVAFTFATGDEQYDELPWAKAMLTQTRHPHEICYLAAPEVPDLVAKIQKAQDEPFGGFPTLAYSKIFQRAREMGIIVLLDGQGMDEQWAGYEYYQPFAGSNVSSLPLHVTGPVQASKNFQQMTACMTPEFLREAGTIEMPTVFPDALRNIQYRDAFISKIPRALRFNDRISMMHGTELREPFLDHRLFELAFRQKPELKIRNGKSKWLLRKIVKELMPFSLAQAPKRPVQTPQREWLKGPLREWAQGCLEDVVKTYEDVWFEKKKIATAWDNYMEHPVDNSFHIWQWISLAMMSRQANSNSSKERMPKAY